MLSDSKITAMKYSLATTVSINNVNEKVRPDKQSSAYTKMSYETIC